MPRRVATQVHQATSRLLRAGQLTKPPAWYQAVLTYPPLPLPSRAPPPRSTYDLPPPNASATHHHAHHQVSKHLRTPKPKTQGIYYTEDKIRRQFFRDHPFEAFTPRSLLEGAEVSETHPINGSEWTRLRQRGRNPSSEDTIEFALNLHEHHSMPLSVAYQTAVSQFRSLRSEHAIANSFAAQEAEAYGAQFGPTEVERGFAIEQKALQSWQPESATMGETAGQGKRPWAPTWVDASSKAEWTRGQDYTQKWKAGVLPDYKPPEAVESTGTEELHDSDPVFEAVSQKRRSYG